MIRELTRAVTSRQAVNPRTVLGFYATVIGLALGACVFTVATLRSSEQYGWLIPWILAFGGLLVIALVAGVFVISLSDPSKLMLTQVTGSEYAEIQKYVVLGSSATGERIVSTDTEPIQGERLAEIQSGSAIDLGPSSELEEEK